MCSSPPAQILTSVIKRDNLNPYVVKETLLFYHKEKVPARMKS